MLCSQMIANENPSVITPPAASSACILHRSPIGNLKRPVLCSLRTLFPLLRFKIRHKPFRVNDLRTLPKTTEEYPLFSAPFSNFLFPFSDKFFGICSSAIFGNPFRMRIYGDGVGGTLQHQR